jgi:hypothetical protein
MIKKQRKLYLLLAISIVILLLTILWFLKPIIIEKYCENQAKKIVGNQWDKLYKAEGYEKQYVTKITWGFREQLKCERRLR